MVSELNERTMKKQQTLKMPVSIEGIGLQTGGKVKLNLKPSPANSGISFIRTDLPDKPLVKAKPKPPVHHTTTTHKTTAPSN